MDCNPPPAQQENADGQSGLVWPLSRGLRARSDGVRKRVQTGSIVGAILAIVVGILVGLYTSYITVLILKATNSAEPIMMMFLLAVWRVNAVVALISILFILIGVFAARQQSKRATRLWLISLALHALLPGVQFIAIVVADRIA